MPTDLTLSEELPDSLPPVVPAPSELMLRFNGDATDYFRIWAVNLCLTLLTLGVFSAWAKVRKKRYFYSHTTIDGTPFQYLAQPLPILKGRVIAFVLLALWYVASHFYTTFIPYLVVLGVVIAPWMVFRSAAFNARYSAFRNMTFHFNSGYWDAIKAIYGWQGVVVCLLVVGLIYQKFNADAGFSLSMVMGLAVIILGMSYAWWMRRFKFYLVTRSSFGGNAGEFAATGRQFFRIYFVAGLIVTLAAIVGGGLGIAGGSALEPGPLQMLVIMVPIYAGYVVAFGFMQARTGNLVWSSTALGPLRFESTLKGGELGMLYLTNAIAILGSLGLLIPWAVIRTLRYRAEHMRVFTDDSLNAFHGQDKTAVQAAGSEVGEFFDMDVSL